MISYIRGLLVEKKEDAVIVELNGIGYEILVPPAVMNAIDDNIDESGQVKLVVYHYYQTEPSRSFPVMVGFFNMIEKEFFEKFITVSGVGPKAAVKALSLPISVIAKAIYDGDIKTLTSLSGIGAQRARQIVAKLQDKVGKYGLMKEEEVKAQEIASDSFDEAVAILLQLQYSKTEAESMVKTALNNNSALKSAEDILNEVYKQRVGFN